MSLNSARACMPWCGRRYRNRRRFLAETFPLTHFLRIVRGVVLRDAGLPMLSADVWPLGVFFLVVITFATLRFRKRLD